ncbi:MFS transporter [Methanoculleus sp. FWC-SCC3]|uniref:MFS transporter n=1 Tax=Methanoculleus methanifontis TaxID=2584086 RepID=A0ABT8M2M3_9EURY|nr:MFS transporter [Methanoculleus sp. FWC-SCC3]MDN7013288.1 MFS transporter [Methanoculleus sp. FWC-SCC3]
MLQKLPILLGVFVVMALSNAVVPVLPDFAEGAALQGVVYSAYFLGAFVAVLPAGLASDRIGSVPLIRTGLLLTLASGILILLFPSDLPLLIFRVVEGIGAGLFLSAALAWANSQPPAGQLSGYVMAALNLGLVVGLLATGWLDALFGSHLAGIALFTALTVPAAAMSFIVRESERVGFAKADFVGIVRNYFWLFAAAVVLVGMTGAVAAVYPEYTGNDSSVLALQLATINIATIIALLVTPRLALRPAPTIRAASLLMAVAVLAGYFTPYAFPAIGALSGVFIVAALAFLAETRIEQGVMTGLFNTATYAGFTFLSALAGLVAGGTGFLAAFLLLAGMAVVVAVPIGRCRCEYRG